MIRRRSYVMVLSGADKGHVAQVVDHDPEKQTFALFVNYNGFSIFVKQHQIREATLQEKKKDKKQHSREHQLNSDEHIQFYDARYINKYTWVYNSSYEIIFPVVIEN